MLAPHPADKSPDCAVGPIIRVMKHVLPYQMGYFVPGPLRLAQPIHDRLGHFGPDSLVAIEGAFAVLHLPGAGLGDIVQQGRPSHIQVAGRGRVHRIQRVPKHIVGVIFILVHAVAFQQLRRFIRRVGREHLDNLFSLRIADNIGNGLKEAEPESLIQLRARVWEVLKREDALTLDAPAFLRSAVRTEIQLQTRSLLLGEMAFSGRLGITLVNVNTIIDPRPDALGREEFPVH